MYRLVNFLERDAVDMKKKQLTSVGQGQGHSLGNTDEIPYEIPYGDIEGVDLYLVLFNPLPLILLSLSRQIAQSINTLHNLLF